MSALPDGASAGAYLHLRDVDRAGLMWEWLRRDETYVAWYLRASTATRGPLEAPLGWELLFPEDPARCAPDATIVWRAELDPGAVRVAAIPSGPRNPDALPPVVLRRWMNLIVGPDGIEHAVLSDGWRHIRLDIEQGTLRDGPVVLQYRLQGIRQASTALLTLRRLTTLCLTRRFSPSLFPRDPRIARGLLLLRVYDALRSGATQREVAETLFGTARAKEGWAGRSDSLRSRVRRLAVEARNLAAGGYRGLMRGGS